MGAVRGCVLVLFSVLVLLVFWFSDFSELVPGGAMWACRRCRPGPCPVCERECVYVCVRVCVCVCVHVCVCVCGVCVCKRERERERADRVTHDDGVHGRRQGLDAWYVSK